ncbi:TPA: hypothetical protein SLV10_007060, partial [Pseudomonas aeruginosa]|nr:hypothetical protein [Pseudomonas aeruginosa]
MNRFILTAAVLALVSAAAWQLGYQSGDADGSKTKARLELLWPKFDNLPESDRAVLAAYSLACKLHAQPSETTSVIACLRGSASHSDAILPLGMNNEQASARLE